VAFGKKGGTREGKNAPHKLTLFIRNRSWWSGRKSQGGETISVRSVCKERQSLRRNNSYKGKDARGRSQTNKKRGGRDMEKGVDLIRLKNSDG